MREATKRGGRRSGRTAERSVRALRLEPLESRRVLANSYIYGIDNNNVIQEVDVNAQTASPVFDAAPTVGSGDSNAFAYDTARDQFFFIDPGNNLQFWDRGPSLTQLATAAQIGLSSPATVTNQPQNAVFYNNAYWFFTEGTNSLNKVSLSYSGAGLPSFASLTSYPITDAPTTTNTFGDIAVNGSGILYAATQSGQFYSVDISGSSPSAATTILASGNPSLQLSFSSDYGTLYGQAYGAVTYDSVSYDAGQWFTIDLGNGTLAPIAGFAISYTGGSGLRDLGGAADDPAAEADLKIEKSDGVSTVFSGDGVTYTYTITVTNLGPDAAEDVSVADTWPSAFAQGSFGTPSTGSVTQGVNGSFTWSNFTLAASHVATLTVSYTVPFGTAAGSYGNTAVVTSSTLDPDPTNNTATDTNEVITNVLVAGNDEACNSTPRVYVINPYTGAVVSSFLAYADKVFRGGVRVATGDLNDDGVPEVVVTPGAGRVGEVKVFKLDGTPMPGFAQPYLPFGASYKDGIEINVGDVDGDGKDDLVAAKSSGAGDVQVSLSDGTKFTAYKSFTAFSGVKNYRGGSSAAVAGINKIVVGSGPGMAPTVKTFDISATPTVSSTFQPTFPKGTVGVSMTTQNFSGTGLDLIASAGRNGKSQVTVYNGQTNASMLSYNTFASQAKPNSPVYAAASALGSSPVVDTVFMAQGDGGKGTIKKVNATTGVVDATFVPTYLGKPLTSPLRINTNLRKAIVG